MLSWTNVATCVPHDDPIKASDAYGDENFKIYWVPRESAHAFYPDAFPNSDPQSVNERARTARYAVNDYGDCKIDKAEVFIISDPVFLPDAYSDPQFRYWGIKETGSMQCLPFDPSLAGAVSACPDSCLDLRRVIAHEYGHVLGLLDDDVDPDRAWLMSHIFEGSDTHQHSFNPSPCELQYARNLYLDELAGQTCDNHSDAFVDQFSAELVTSGSTQVDWKCASQVGTMGFLLYSGSSGGGPWSLVAQVPVDSSSQYSLLVSAPGPYFRLRELEAGGDTLHCITDSLLASRSEYVPPSQAVIDSIRAANELGNEAPVPVDPNPGPTTDWVCLGPSAWKSAAQPLVNYWNGHGHNARYKEVNYLASQGWPSIKAYLASLYNGGAGALKYVLLMGDCDDHHTFSRDIIPSNYHPNTHDGGSWPPEYATDWDYVDFANDHRPQVAIGRAPVHDVNEVSLFVDKTLRAAMVGTWEIPVDQLGLWVGAEDNGDRTGIRATDAAEMLRWACPTKISIRNILDTFDTPLSSATKQGLAIAAMEEGRSIIAVVGVGANYNDWCGYLNSQTLSWAGTAPNWRLHPFVLGLACGIGNIDVPEYLGRPLIETGLLEPGRGPWGCFGISRGTWTDGSRRMMEQFLARVYRAPGLNTPVGLAALGALQSQTNTQYDELAWSHMLLGDPAVPLSNGTVGSAPSVTISGPTVLSNAESGTWTASANRGDGIYTFAWYRRDLGETAWTVCGSGASITRTMAGLDFELRCDVVSAGMSANTIKCVAYSAGASTITASIGGPTQLACGETGTWITSPTGGQTCGQYTYEWRPSTDNGATWGSVVGTASSYSASYSYNVMLKVTVRAVSSSAQASPTRGIAVPCDGGGTGCPTVDVWTAGGWTRENTILGRSTTGSVLLDDYRLRASPDSSTGHLSLRVRENEQEYTTLDQVRLIAVDHSLSTRAYGAGEKVLLGVPIPAARVMKSNGEDVTTQVNGGTGYTGQPGDTLIVDQVLPSTASTASASPATAPSATQGGGGGGDIIDDGGGKGAQPIARNLRGPKPGATVDPDAQVLSTSGILVQAPDGPGGWQTITQYYPRENPDGAVLDTVGYDRLRLVFVGQHSIRFLGHLQPTTESIVATKLPLVAAMHSRYGDVSGAVSALGNVTTDLAPGDTVSLAFRNVPLEPGKMRDLFLLSNGVYTSNLPAGAHPADPPVPIRYALYRNRPNPFSAVTTIRFDLPRAGNVKLEVFDLQGRLIKTLANGAYEAGTFSIAWAHTSDSGQPVRPGIYMYRMIAGGFRAQEKMLLLP
jgi:hypothetical protein